MFTHITMENLGPKSVALFSHTFESLKYCIFKPCSHVMKRPFTQTSFSSVFFTVLLAGNYDLYTNFVTALTKFQDLK